MGKPPRRSTKTVRPALAYAEARAAAPTPRLTPPPGTAATPAAQPPGASTADAATDHAADLAAADMLAVLGALDLERLPPPAELPSAAPDAAAAPPGRVPAGDARSLRRAGADGRAEFALVYRHACVVVTRQGPVGAEGCWRTTTYPTPSAAARAYALEVSRLTHDGFVDYAA